jgi:hypothetical protein
MRAAERSLLATDGASASFRERPAICRGTPPTALHRDELQERAADGDGLLHP